MLWRLFSDFFECKNFDFNFKPKNERAIASISELIADRWSAASAAVAAQQLSTAAPSVNFSADHKLQRQQQNVVDFQTMLGGVAKPGQARPRQSLSRLVRPLA